MDITDLFDTLYAEPGQELTTQRRTLRTAALGQDSSQLEGATPSGIEEAV